MGFAGGKRAKNDPKLPILVCFALYLRNCRSYHQDFDNDIYRCLSLYFFKKWNIVGIKIILFLLAYFNSFLNNNLFFKFISKCQKEVPKKDVPHLLDMCVIFFKKKITKTNWNSKKSQKKYFFKVWNSAACIAFIDVFLTNCCEIYQAPMLEGLEQCLWKSLAPS